MKNTNNMNKLNDPVIVCSAIKLNTDLIITGARHFDTIMRNTIKEILKNKNLKLYNDNPSKMFTYCVRNCEQGFIDQFGNFYNRYDAYIIAEKNNQIKRRVGGDFKKLFSENLY